jgi:hypothetical protein
MILNLKLFYKYDIVVFLEIWLTDQSLVESFLPEYDLHFVSGIKHALAGRAMAGIVVFIRKSFSKNVTRVFHYCDLLCF